MAADDEVSKTFDYLVSEGFQFTFLPDERGEHINTPLDGRSAPQYRLSKECDGSVSVIPTEVEQGQPFGFIVESKPSEDALLGSSEGKWVDGGEKRIRDTGHFLLQAKAPGLSETRDQVVYFRLNLGFSYLVKEEAVDIKVDVKWLSAAVTKRFSLDYPARHASSVFGYYVDRIDVILSPQGLIGGITPRTHPRMESSEVAVTKEGTRSITLTASAKPAAELGTVKKRGRERKVQTMRETSHVIAEEMDAAGFRWEVIRWEHDNGFDYNKIAPEHVWLNSSSTSRQQIQLPYNGDGPGIQKDSFWAIWEVSKDKFAGDKAIQLKVNAVIHLRLLYQKYCFKLVPGWFFGSVSKKLYLEESADTDLKINFDTTPRA